MNVLITNGLRWIIRLCNKCSQYKYWIHIADTWTNNEILEMVEYLLALLEKREVFIP